MPAVLAASWFIPLMASIGAAGSLATTGYTLAQGGGGSSSSSQQQQAAAAAQQTAAQQAQQKAAVIAEQGNTQANTGGSLTPTSFLTSSAKSAGVPSDLNSIMQYLGGGGSSSAPISGGTTTPNSGQQGDPNNLQQLSDLLKAA